MKRAAVLRDAAVASGIGQFAAIQAVGSVGMELSAIDLRDVGEIERAIADFAQHPNGGLIVTASQFGTNCPPGADAGAAALFFFLLEPVANRGVVTGGGELEPYRKGSCVVTGPSKIGYACPRCKTIMDEVVRIAPLESEPGLIGYECPACCYVTSVLCSQRVVKSGAHSLKAPYSEISTAEN